MKLVEVLSRLSLPSFTKPEYTMQDQDFEQVLHQFISLSLEDKAKFLLKATFETAFSAFETLTDVLNQTFEAATGAEPPHDEPATPSGESEKPEA